MKKLILYLTTIFIALSFNACSNDNDDEISDAIIGNWRLSQLIMEVDGEIIDDALTECDKKTTIEFLENGTYTAHSFLFNDDESACEPQATTYGTWKNLTNHMYTISEIEIPEITINLELKITFESNKMVMEFNTTIEDEEEEIDISVKIIFIKNEAFEPDAIIGKWQLEQNFQNDTEVVLNECEKMMTIEFFEDGIYEEKDFQENQNLECTALEIKHGTWKNVGNTFYELTNLDVPLFEITFENEKMIVEYDFLDNGTTTKEKLIFKSLNS